MSISYSVKFYWLIYLLIGFCSFSIAQATPQQPSQYTICFTPGANCTALLIRQIQSAKTSVYVQAYSFTSHPIAQALAQAHARGIKVSVIVDKSQRGQNSHSAANWLNRQGVPVWIDYRPAIAHNKIMIIDNQAVATGSFNFTLSAQQRNAENLIIIRDPGVAKQYLANWQQRQQVSSQFKPEPESEASWLEQLWRWLEKQIAKLLKQELKRVIGH